MNEIRPAAVSDIEWLATLHAASFGQAAWNAAQIGGSLALSTTGSWLILHDTQPAGFALCQILPEQSEILTFCIEPAQQRHGLGEQLLQAICTDLTQRSGALWLEVAADNQAALNLYQKTGFIITSCRKDYYHRPNNAVDALILAKTLKAE